MHNLYPLLLSPDFIERIWGSRTLEPFYTSPRPDIAIGEVWLTGDRCQVQNGEHAGRTLEELSASYGEDLAGTLAPHPHKFPLLMKVLFPKEKLSVQVHPDDEAARALGEPCGKTECWYVLEASPGAQVAAGLKSGTMLREIEQAIREVRLEQLLNWFPVEAGDMIYVDAGTVHAIGPGSILLETQQNSDTTYRLYDYGRPRELHLERGLAALKLETAAGKVRSVWHNGHRRLVDCPCFVVKHFGGPSSVQGRTLATSEENGELSTVHCLFALRGRGQVMSPVGEVSFGRGDVVVIPACVQQYEVSAEDGDFEFVCAHLPSVRPEALSRGAQEAVTTVV